MDDPVGTWLTSLLPDKGLSPAQDRVFEVICNNHQLASFSDVADIATKAGVDNSTVVRNAQSLGFRGWPSLQHELRARYLAELTSEQTLDEHSDQLKSTGQSKGAGQSEGVVHEAIRRDIDNLRRSLETVDADTAALVVRRLVDAEHVTVAAMGSAVGPATVLSHLGMNMGYDVTLEGRGGVNLAASINRLSRGDVLVVINLWRPIRDLVNAAAAARELGVTVVAITDMRKGALASRADYSLIVPSEGMSYFQSTTAAMSVVYGLLAGMQAMRPDETRAAIRRIQQLWRDIGTYST